MGDMQNYEMYEVFMRQFNEVNYRLDNMEEALNKLVSLVSMFIMHQSGIKLEDLFKEEERKNAS